MIDRTQLLADLQVHLRKLEADLLERSSSVSEVEAVLRSDYEQAKDAERTAQSYEEWRSDAITQMASAWVLSGVFVRFLEDNQLIDPPVVAGLGERLQWARDEHELYFRQHPQDTDRDYWLMVFDRLAKLPGGGEIFGANNRIRELPNWLSGDAAGELLRFFQRVEPETGRLVHDFTDENWDTRFLGDLYQDLSEAARKKYALLQTPEFVESFILDRTLEPALDEFQLEFQRQEFRMIDPACGSGHFLLGSFHRLLDRWIKKEPATAIRELVLRSLKSIHGIDINPYAVAITRFRLLLAAMKQEPELKRLLGAPDYKIQVVCGDSLLHGDGTQLAIETVLPKNHYYKNEDIAALNRVLIRGHYHAVVANPPYITPKDSAANDAYRKLYKETCYRQYSLAVPFLQRIYLLAVPGGFTGQITANLFMKREFGKKLIENFIPSIDLTHVIDTSGAYIPGHGTPTVILFGRNRKPIASTIRAVMGIRGEPSTPENPTEGLVWSAILNQIDQNGSQSEFVSVADSLRLSFCKHPWSIGGGGATDLKVAIEEVSDTRLNDVIETICSLCLTRADEVYLMPPGVLPRQQIKRSHQMVMVIGEQVRDWGIHEPEFVLFPYDQGLKPVSEQEGLAVHRFLWRYKEILWRRRELGGDHRELNRTWWEWNRFLSHRFQMPQSIAFAPIATHNHFVFDRGGKIFKQSAPVIKLPVSATEDDHLALLGLLNSSVACFWIKQVVMDKGNGGIGGGIGDEKWERRSDIDASKLKFFPVVQTNSLPGAKNLQESSDVFIACAPGIAYKKTSPNVENILVFKAKREQLRKEMIALQEELDWQCYQLYGLIDEDFTHPEPPPIALGQRAFEIVMARKMAAGELQTTWFERHNSIPITELPSEWPDDYKQLVQKRIELIESDRNIALIEQPEYKRRWNTEPWNSQLERALRGWLCDRLETYFDFDGRMCPHPPTPSPQGEGEQDRWDFDASKLAGQMRQVPEALLQRARELRQNQTPAEEVLWECLRDRRLLEAKFRRQHNLGQYIADFYCHAARLVIELDGEIHQSQPEQDRDRDQWMQDNGFTILRFPNNEVLEKIDHVLAQIAQYLLSPPLPGERGQGGEGKPSAKIDISLISIAQLTDLARHDPEFLQVGELYRKDAAFDVLKLVAELVEAESVPLLPVLRYKPSGLRKRAEWEHTWSLQRLEDAIDDRTKLPKDHPDHAPEFALKALKQQAIGDIPVPPKYTSSDFQKSHYWRLRGKLDVPKERWVSFPHCNAEDGTVTIAWAGYNHLQLAQAISTYFITVKEELGGRNDPRLSPLLASLIELLPWLKQWHNDLDPTYNLVMSDYFESFIQDEARDMGKTLDEISAWQPPAKTGRRR